MSQEYESENVATTIEELLTSSSFGLVALKILLDDIEAKLDSPIFGLQEIKDEIVIIDTILDNTEILLKYPSVESFDDIAAVGPTNTTAMPIVVVIPAGATIRRAMLAAFITVMNDTATLQKIDVDVQGSLPPGGWNTYFTENACIGVPNVDAATTGFVPVQDVSALVNAAGAYSFRCAITQTAASSVHYTINYILIITYRMS